MHLKKLLLLLLLALLVGLFFVFDLGQYLNLQTLKAQQASIEDFRAGRPLLAIAIYFSVYVLMAALKESLPHLAKAMAQDEHAGFVLEQGR